MRLIDDRPWTSCWSCRGRTSRNCSESWMAIQWRSVCWIHRCMNSSPTQRQKWHWWPKLQVYLWIAWEDVLQSCRRPTPCLAIVAADWPSPIPRFARCRHEPFLRLQLKWGEAPRNCQWQKSWCHLWQQLKNWSCWRVSLRRLPMLWRRSKESLSPTRSALWSSFHVQPCKRAVWQKWLSSSALAPMTWPRPPMAWAEMMLAPSCQSTRPRALWSTILLWAWILTVLASWSPWPFSVVVAPGQKWRWAFAVSTVEIQPPLRSARRSAWTTWVARPSEFQLHDSQQLSLLWRQRVSQQSRAPQRKPSLGCRILALGELEIGMCTLCRLRRFENCLNSFWSIQIDVMRDTLLVVCTKYMHKAWADNKSPKAVSASTILATRNFVLLPFRACI